MLGARGVERLCIHVHESTLQHPTMGLLWQPCCGPCAAVHAAVLANSAWHRREMSCCVCMPCMTAAVCRCVLCKAHGTGRLTRWGGWLWLQASFAARVSSRFSLHAGGLGLYGGGRQLLQFCSERHSSRPQNRLWHVMLRRSAAGGLLWKEGMGPAEAVAVCSVFLWLGLYSYTFDCGVCVSPWGLATCNVTTEPIADCTCRSDTVS